MDSLISRQAAIDAILAVTGNSSVRELYEHVQEHGLSNMWSGGVNAAIDTIIAVPSAEAERKTGHWIPLATRRAWICSECKKENAYAYSWNEKLEDTLQDYFCPNCGADMRERRPK